MRASSFVLIAAAALTQVVNATDGGGSQYMTVTTTCWSTTEKTMWSTVTQTDYVTVPTTTTDYVTTTETKIVPTTVIVTKTDTQTTTQIVPTTITNVVTTVKVVPTTITVVSTTTQHETDLVTTIVTRVVPTSIIGTVTQINTVTITSVRLTTNTETAILVSDHTATASVTSVSVVEKTITIFVTVSAEPVTISVPAPQSVSVSITGLVLCPYRSINPTYTTSGIPDDWTWGCRPGKVCKPKQQGCNFERDYPSDNYYCSPEECIDAPYLPPDTNLEGPWNTYTCGKLFTPISGYFNALPASFGYSYNIFAFGGQTATPCSSLPVTQISDGQVQAPTGPAVTQISDGQPQAPTGAPVSQISDGQVQASVTKRAVLLERQAGQAAVPNECWDPCESAGYAAQATGKQYNLLCPTSSSFLLHLSACNRCIGPKRDAPDNKVTPLIPSIGQYIGYCNTQRAARESSTSAELQQTTSASSAAVRPTSNSVVVVTGTAPAAPPESSPTPPSANSEVGPALSSSEAPATTVASSISSSPPPVTQITDGQPQAPATSAFTGAASSIVVPKDSWWLTLLSFLLAFI